MHWRHSLKIILFPVLGFFLVFGVWDFFVFHYFHYFRPWCCALKCCCCLPFIGESHTRRDLQEVSWSEQPVSLDTAPSGLWMWLRCKKNHWAHCSKLTETEISGALTKERSLAERRDLREPREKTIREKMGKREVLTSGLSWGRWGLFHMLH